MRGGSAVPQDMIAVPFGVPEAFMIVASPGYLQAQGRPTAPADLLRHACIRVRMPSGALLPWDFERHGEQISIEPPGRLVVGSPGLAIQAAVADAGIAYVIERAMSDELASGRLVRLLDDWTPPFPGVSLYYPRQRLPSAGLAAFIEHFKATRRRETMRP